MRFLAAMLFFVSLSGCVRDECDLRSDNEILALVLTKTSQKPCQCTGVVQMPAEVLEEWDRPNFEIENQLMINVDLFKKSEIREAVSMLLKTKPLLPEAEILDAHGRSRSATASQLCGTTYYSPLVIGDFAFVQYSQPGGSIRWIAMKEIDGRWSVIEDVLAGYW